MFFYFKFSFNLTALLAGSLKSNEIEPVGNERERTYLSHTVPFSLTPTVLHPWDSLPEFVFFVSCCSIYDVCLDFQNNTAVIVVSDTKLRGAQMLWVLLLAGGRLPVIARRAIMTGENGASTLFMSTGLWQ